MKHLIGLLLACVAFGQSYTMTAPDGSKLSGPLAAAGEAFELRIRNGGKPDNWGLSYTPNRTWGWTPGDPVCFDALEVEAPGKTLLVGGLYGAAQIGSGRFLLARPTDWKVPALRGGADLWPGTEGHHRIFPGDTLYARLVPADDPWDLRYLATIPAAGKASALAVMGWNEARMARWPWLAKMVGQYRYDAGCLNPNAAPGSRSMGWLLIPANFSKRWYGLPVAQIAHWYGLGHRSAVGGENLTNEHYGNEAAWLGVGLRNGDPVALQIGLYLLRQKIAYGLIDCDDTGCWMWGKWRNEKGEIARGSTGMSPSPAKEWDKGLAMASVLLPNDAFIQRAAGIRKAYLLTAQHPWGGSGGARNLGHFLENLRHWYVATGDVRFQNKAATEITYAMGVVGGDPYIRDNPGSVSGGEGLCALSALRWWCFNGGVCAQFRGRLDSIMAWYVANLLDAAGGATVTYSTVSGATVTSRTYGSPMPGTNWLQCVGIDPVVAEKIASAAFTKYAQNPDCDAAFGGEGPGWEKFMPWIVNYGACDL